MKKKFDAVVFQQKMREELGKKYSLNREEFLHELELKYGRFKNREIGTEARNQTSPGLGQD